MPGNTASAPSLTRVAALAAALLAAVALAACGSSQDANVPTGNFPVQVTAATFPAHQALSQHNHLVITVRNAGTRAIPDLAVSICPNSCSYVSKTQNGTSSAVFDSNVGQDSLNDAAPPDWVVEQQPGPCYYSCKTAGGQSGGGGAWATQNPNTWAIGEPLPPGASRTFDWRVVPVKAGHYVVAWQVASDLYAKSHAVMAGSNMAPAGTFVVTVSGTPTRSYVNNNGQIEPGSGQGNP